MSVDSEIVWEMPDVLMSSVRSVGVQSCGVLVAGYLTWRLTKYLYVRQLVRRVREENRASLRAGSQQLARQVEESGLAREELREVTELSWPDLLSHLQSGQLSALTALTAYQAAALQVAEKTNCVTQWLEEAVQEARRLDQLPADSRGPLHGVPVSVKECYEVAGTFATAGMTVFSRKKAEKDCPLVEMIKQLGGVPFCKTNVPQSMMSIQCSNPIYGTSSNPHSQPGNPRECGGSSGGEGALLGGGGSILGLGSDIGGSLRSPVAFCGAVSLKPTAGRHLSQLGVTGPSPAPPVGIPVTGGFMTTSVQALEDSWRIVWNLEREKNVQKHDTGIIPPRWDQALYDKKPKVGYFTSNNLIEAAPGCVRVVTETVETLEAAGYDVVKIPSPDISEVLYYFNGIVLADQNKGLYQNLSYDLYDSSLTGMVMAMTTYKMPWLLKKLVLHPLVGLLSRVSPIEKVFDKSEDLWEGIQQRDAFARKYLELLDSAGVDVIICPGQQLPAPPTGRLGTMLGGILPYIPWNTINFPAGILPVSTWGPADEKEMENYPQDDILYKMIKSCCVGAQGMPLAVQVVGKPFMDEQVLKMMSILEDLLGKKKNSK